MNLRKVHSNTPKKPDNIWTVRYKGDELPDDVLETILEKDIYCVWLEKGKIFKLLLIEIREDYYLQWVPLHSDVTPHRSLCEQITGDGYYGSDWRKKEVIRKFTREREEYMPIVVSNTNFLSTMKFIQKEFKDELAEIAVTE